MMMTCAYDAIAKEWRIRSYILYAFIFHYCVPMMLVFFFYIQIVKAVVLHERMLREQAKKMNVESLRSGQVTLSWMNQSLKNTMIPNYPAGFFS